MNMLAKALSVSKVALSNDDPKGAFQAVQDILAETELSALTITLVSKQLKKIEAHSRVKNSLDQHKVAVLSGKQTAGFITDAIRCVIAREGRSAEIFLGAYNGVAIEVIDPNSDLYKFKPDLVVICLSWRDIIMARDTSAFEECLSLFHQMWGHLQDRLGVPVIQTVLDRPAVNGVGIAERHINDSLVSLLERINTRSMSESPGSLYWLDLNTLSTFVGLRQWSLDRDYFVAKLPFSNQHLGLYTDWFSGVYRTAIGRTRKCLIVDLDNTLWGGEVGDDGVDGIVFGEGSPIGEAYLSFCEYLLTLKERGVILGVCSKNDHIVAQSVFSLLADMPLALKDFSAFVANWDDKPGNIRMIAERLNIGLDAFVFVDDNSVECAFVRQELPEVITVELPKDPADFVNVLDGMHLFDTQTISDTDRLRTQSYQALQRSEDDWTSADSIESFLSSLKMTVHIDQDIDLHLDRMVQMQIRTNQFNLTTRRYTTDQILADREDKSVCWLIAGLKDKYGEHGIVSTMRLVREGNFLRIDDWLMSCRVFSRTLEECLFNWTLNLARTQKIEKIYAEYLSTDRNNPVKTLYERLGFSSEDGQGRWWGINVLNNGDSMTTYISLENGISG